MSADTDWKHFCKELYPYPDAGLRLDLSCAGLADNFQDKHQELLTRTFGEMAALESGEKVNLNEKRMVGHYWLRAANLAPDKKLAQAILREKEKVVNFAAEILQGSCAAPDGAPFTHFILVGIGGQSLGPQLIADAFSSTSSKLKAHFIDNIDQQGISRVFAVIGSALKHTLVIVSSKSGTTPETQHGATIVRREFEKRNLAFPKQAVSISLEGSELDKTAANEAWLGRFFMWDWVGGRTSITSAAGLLPAALLGVDIERFLAGARVMDELTRKNNLRMNPAAMLALAWFELGKGQGDKALVTIPYRDRLAFLGRYLQQLIMESLGKAEDRQGKPVKQGLTVYGNKGSTDQHAYIQQLRDGLDNFFVTFVDVLSDTFPGSSSEHELEPGIYSSDYLNGFFIGTRQALKEKGRASISITLDELSPLTLGALIALFERAVGFYASFVNINAYDQPGVEAGKRAAKRVLALQQQIQKTLDKKEMSVEELAKTLGAIGEEDTIYRVLEHLAANPRYGVIRVGSATPVEARYRR